MGAEDAEEISVIIFQTLRHRVRFSLLSDRGQHSGAPWLHKDTAGLSLWKKRPNWTAFRKTMVLRVCWKTRGLSLCHGQQS